MFEFITISNGVAVVQHAPSGQVYRFRPVHRGVWSALTQDRIGDVLPSKPGPDNIADAARVFAETTTSAIFDAMNELPFATQASSRSPRRAFGLLRPRVPR